MRRLTPHGIHCICINSVVATIAVFMPYPAQSEYLCTADVSYKWTKNSDFKNDGNQAADSNEKVDKKDGKDAKEGDKDSGEAKDKSQPEIPGDLVRFASVERTGADEAAAKAALEVEINRIKVRASSACKKEHESLGSCTATKLSVQASTLNSLSFSARKELEKSIIAECEKQAGTCISAVSTEPACKEKVVAATPTGGAEEGKDKKGDDKKKK